MVDRGDRTCKQGSERRALLIANRQSSPRRLIVWSEPPGNRAASSRSDRSPARAPLTAVYPTRLPVRPLYQRRDLEAKPSSKFSACRSLRAAASESSSAEQRTPGAATSVLSAIDVWSCCAPSGSKGVVASHWDGVSWTSLPLPASNYRGGTLWSSGAKDA